MERILLSVLPIVAEPAALDLAEMDLEQLVRLRADRLRGVENLS